MVAPGEAQALWLHRSNRTEQLAAALANVLRTPLPDPFAPDIVVVQSAEMGRWLSLQMAQEHGVCANVVFDFPGKVLELLCNAVATPRRADETPAVSSGWSRDELLWAVLGALPELLPREELAPLRGYLRAEESPCATEGPWDRRAVQLARRIAATFDRYLTYRPEMIRAWDAGDGPSGDWQPLLWRALRTRIAAPHLVQRTAQLLAAIGAPQAAPSRWPARLCLFAIATLPPAYLDVFYALARRVPVHLFLLCPSPAYWADLCGKRERARMLRDAPLDALADVDLHLVEGNPLLAAFGRLGRQGQWVLEGRAATTPYVEPAASLFESPGRDSALHVLQADVFELLHRRPGPAAGAPLHVDPVPLAGGDRSITIHACHGKIRQVEVLRNELLAACAADHALQPRDVVIMTPDLEGFAPLVEAVFSDGDRDRLASPGPTPSTRGGLPALPVRVADRSRRRTSPVADGLLRVLELAQGRLTASAVFDLLVLEPVQRRFALVAEDLPVLRQWVGAAGVRWALDAEDRQRHDQPAYAENTWRFGLDRLLLGRAMSEDDGEVFAGLLPCGEIEGDTAELLGRFVGFAETLCATLRSLRVARPMPLWARELSVALAALMQPSDADLWHFAQVGEVLEELGEQACAAGLGDDALTLDALRALLEGRFAEPSGSGRFGSGAITLCAMVPLRSIPFRVVCLLGMDDDTFPRQEAAPGFDLIAARPRPGDRSARDDDHYLFLEALLAARDRVIITYQGRGIRDNQSLPPAVPVGELLEVINDSFLPAGDRVADADAVHAQVHMQHPLQAFSPRNFGADAVGIPLSFDGEYLEGARGLCGARAPAPPFLREPLPLATAEPSDASPVAPRLRTLELPQLARFLAGPCQAFFNQRLGVWLGEGTRPAAEREPLEPDDLERYALGDDLLRWATEAPAHSAPLVRLRAAGRLPLGRPGERLFARLDRDVAPLAAQVRALQHAPRRAAAALDFVVDDTRLVGHVDGLWADRLLVFQYGKLKAKHLLALWVSHLALRFADAEPPELSSLVGRGDGPRAAVWTLGPIARAEARAQLRMLVGHYWQGLQAPLLFFPETARAYYAAQAERPEGPPSLWEDRARSVWRPERPVALRAPAEGEDLHARRLLGDAEPFDPNFHLPGLAHAESPRFAELATAIWQPLIAVLRDEAER